MIILVSCAVVSSMMICSAISNNHRLKELEDVVDSLSTAYIDLETLCLSIRDKDNRTVEENKKSQQERADAFFKLEKLIKEHERKLKNG